MTNEEQRFRLSPNYFGCCFVQTMNVLIVNQSVIDLLASVAVLTSVAQPDGTRMSPNNSRHQLVLVVTLYSFNVQDVKVDVRTQQQNDKNVRK